MFTVFLVIQVIVTLAMVGMILVQRSDADGLAGLSGGGGGSNSFMTGRAAASFMTRTTAILAVVFMLNSLWLAKLSTDTRSSASLADRIALEEDNPLNAPVPADVDAQEVMPQVPVDGETSAPAAQAPTPGEVEAPAETSEAPEVPTP